jgi:hypothetical protein
LRRGCEQLSEQCERESLNADAGTDCRYDTGSDEHEFEYEFEQAVEYEHERQRKSSGEPSVIGNI